VAERLEAKYLIAFTQSGDTALRLARYRTEVPLLAFTPVPSVSAWLSVVWGIETHIVPTVDHTDEMVRQVDQRLLELGKLQKGDLVVIVAGSPPSIPGSTNALRVHRMGDAIEGIAPAYRSPNP
jgi:pyruvate kinase